MGMELNYDWEAEAEGDHLSFDDSDRFEEDSLCSWISGRQRHFSVPLLYGGPLPPSAAPFLFKEDSCSFRYPLDEAACPLQHPSFPRETLGSAETFLVRTWLLDGGPTSVSFSNHPPFGPSPFVNFSFGYPTPGKCSLDVN